MKIDLRSDTITKPTAAMLQAMMQAEVGDDVFQDDPTVNHLEQYCAQLFGMESALFCTSGTLTNQLAIRIHCAPGSEVICDALSHIFLYEGGGVAVNALSSIKVLQGNYGRICAEQVTESINNSNDIHQATTRLVSLENTMNKGGGSIYDFAEIIKIKEVCQQHDLKLHLDGARLFNALIETKETPKDYGNVFDSISICLSKGLGCPIGSLLLGSAECIKKARRFRKLMGGGWRQAGYLAAAGLFALENNIERLHLDHQRAKTIGQMLSQKNFVKSIYPVVTNIVIFELVDGISSAQFVNSMAQKDIHCFAFGKQHIRFVTHLDFTDEHLMRFEEVLNSAL